MRTPQLRWSCHEVVPARLRFVPAARPGRADVQDGFAKLAPAGLVRTMDAEGHELVPQNTDKPFVPASPRPKGLIPRYHNRNIVNSPCDRRSPQESCSQHSSALLMPALP